MQFAQYGDREIQVRAKIQGEACHTNSSYHLMLAPSPLAAIRIGLIQHLQSTTGIQWDYYKSLVLPEEGAKGGVFVTGTRLPTGINYTRTTHELQLQLLVADADHQKAQSLLCDWGSYLVGVMVELKQEGLYGEYRNVKLEAAMAGCKLLDGIKYYVQDSDQRQDIPEGIAIGTLQANYEFMYESGIQLY